MRKLLGVALFIAMSILPLRASDWPTFHHDAARTGNSEDKEIRTPLKLLWKYDTAGPVRSSPAVAKGVVYIGSYDHKVYALDAKTGELKWSYITGGAVHSSPVVANGLVYIGSADGIFYVLEAKTGELKWSYKVEGDNTPFMLDGLFKASSQSILSSPAVVDGLVYFGAGMLKDRPGGFYALDAKTGALKWHYKAKGGVLTSPVISGKMVYFVDEALQALDKDAGEVKWSGGGWVVDAGEWGQEKVWHAHWSGLSAGKDTIYFFGHSTYGAILAINAGSGEAKWTLQIRRGKDGSYYSSPALTDEVVYWGFQYWKGDVQGFDIKDGSSKKRFSIHNAYSSPAIANGFLFVGSDDSRIYGCDLKEEKVVWSYATGGKVRSSAAVADGNLFIGSDDGKIYAFGGAR